MKNVWRTLGPNAALLIVLTVAVYLPSLRGGFVFDDHELIIENRTVQASDGLYRFWFTSESPDYRPLAWSLWWLEWRLWDGRPMGYHMVNVLLHAVNAVLIWLVLRRLKVPGAWLAAALFAIHPVTVATGAWISEEKNTLSMLFFALSILLYLRFDDAVVGPRCCAAVDAEHRVPTNDDRTRSTASLPTTADGERRVPTIPMYVLSLLAFLLALLSKTAVVMLPVVLLGCVWWRHGLVRRRDWLCTIPYFVVALVLSLVTIVQHHRALPSSFVRTGGLAARLAVAGRVPWFYLSKALLPLNLTVIYPKWETDPARWISYVPGALWLGIFLFCWWKRESWGRPVLFGLGYFVVMLFPVLGFFDQGFYYCTLVADHWQYYSIIGVIALAVAAGQRMASRMGEQHRYLGMAAGAAVLIALGVASWKRESVYANDGTLWLDNVTKNPSAWLAQYNRGVDLMRSARLQEATAHYEMALRLNPKLPEAHYNLGLTLARLGRWQEAIGHYEQAVRIHSKYVEPQIDWGVALSQLGRTQEAIGHWEYALRLDPNSSVAHNDLGDALLRLGRVQEAVEHYEQAVRLKPDYAEAHNGLALALAQVDRLQEAIGHWEQALRLNPNLAEAQYNWGLALARQGKMQEAIGHFEQAVRIKPDYASAHNNLALALSQVGKNQEAAGHWEQALRLNPNIPEAHYGLGLVVEQSGRIREAIDHYQQAVRLKADYPDAQNNLAWLLATLEPADGGDPARAVILAERACELTGNRVAPYLDTLAAAYAAAGRFDDAIATAQKAVELAGAAGQPQVAKEVETHLELYRQHRAYRRSANVTSQPPDGVSPK